MKRAPLYVAVCLANCLQGQENGVANFEVPEPAAIRVDLSLLQCAVGPWFSRLSGNLPDASAYLLRTNTAVMSAFPVEVQLIFRDKAGITFATEALSGYLDEYQIRDEFQRYVPDHVIEIPQMERHMGNYDLRFLNAGALWYQSFGRFQFIPYANYLFSFNTWYPGLEVQLTNRSTNNEFTRFYRYECNSARGYKLGAAVRSYYNPGSGKVFRHASFFLQLKAEFTWMEFSGAGHYEDSENTLLVYADPSREFTQKMGVLMLGLTIGGLSFHW